MAKHPSWSDDYWLLLMQLYLCEPVGLKPIYSRGLVELALELHLTPQFLHNQMFRLRQLDTPLIQHLWSTYGQHPKRLQKEVELLRRMNGFGQPSAFYQGVEIAENTWEKDFKPIAGTTITPLMLILVLDLYFRLTPLTMVAETPEVMELAKLIGIDTHDVCHIMQIYQALDPYLQRPPAPDEPLTAACQAVWQRYGNDNPESLEALAAQTKDYFK